MIMFSITKEQNLRINSITDKGKQWIVRLPFAGLLHELQYQKELVAYCIHYADMLEHDIVLFDDPMLKNVSSKYINDLHRVSGHAKQVLTFSEYKKLEKTN